MAMPVLSMSHRRTVLSSWRIILKKGSPKVNYAFLQPLNDPKDVVSKFKAEGCDVQDALTEGSLRIFEITETYLPNAHFSATCMLQNVRSFLRDAESKGYKGLRTAGGNDVD